MAQSNSGTHTHTHATHAFGTRPVPSRSCIDASNACTSLSSSPASPGCTFIHLSADRFRWVQSIRAALVRCDISNKRRPNVNLFIEVIHLCDDPSTAHLYPTIKYVNIALYFTLYHFLGQQTPPSWTFFVSSFHTCRTFAVLSNAPFRFCALRFTVRSDLALGTVHTNDENKSKTISMTLLAH